MDSADDVQTRIDHDRNGPVKVRRLYGSLAGGPAHDWVLANLVVEDRASEEAVMTAIDAVAGSLTELEYEPARAEDDEAGGESDAESPVER